MVREIDLLEWLGQTSQVPNSWSYVMISGPAMLKSTLRNLSLTWPVARESDKLSNENNEMWLWRWSDTIRNHSENWASDFWTQSRMSHLILLKCLERKLGNVWLLKVKNIFTYLMKYRYLQYIWFTFCYEYKAHDSLMKYDYWKRELVLNF